MATEPVLRGARERARAEVTTAIKQTAREHLATRGAAALSLRAVARDLGMVSSAVYRYVASRDDLLTLLIVDAYDSVATAAEQAAAGERTAPPARRFVAVASAIRHWAVANPHEFALIYGSPVPGYAAPETTIPPAARVPVALAGVVVDAHRSGQLRIDAAADRALSGELVEDLQRVREILDLDVADAVLIRVLAAWSQVFGLISFELFGQTANVIFAHADFFAATTLTMAEFIGLSS